MKSTQWKCGTVLLAVLLSLALVLPSAALAGPPDPNSLYKTISVVSTNDFHGALQGRIQSWSHEDMVGGAEWIAGYMNIVREENPGGFLYLDAGDSMQGTLISNYFYGASTIEALNEMGVDAMTVGNHEFDWGQDVLAARQQQAHFPFLGANVYYKGTTDRPDWVVPYVVKPVQGVKVGIIGVANPETPSLANPILVENLDFTEPVAAVEAALPEAEAEGATMVVVLAHLGGFYPDFLGIEEFACALDEERVDLIVSGHTHSRLDDVLCGIPVVQSYSSGTAFSRVDFTIEKSTGEVAEYRMNGKPTDVYQTWFGAPATYERWDTGERVPVMPDPEVAAIVEYYAGLVEELKSELIGETLLPLTRNYRYESVMGDWVTDVMRAYDPDIDFAFTNSGGLRADIDAGPITFGEIFEAQPFDNTLVVVELNGAEVRQVLEEGITGDHGLIQVSGLQFSFDYDDPVGSRIFGDVIDLSTGLPLDPAVTYQVAVNDFMANGGDDYGTLAVNPKVNSYVLVRDVIVQWTQTHSPFTPPDPAEEQRITAFGIPPE